MPWQPDRDSEQLPYKPPPFHLETAIDRLGVPQAERLRQENQLRNSLKYLEKMVRNIIRKDKQV